MIRLIVELICLCIIIIGRFMLVIIIIIFRCDSVLCGELVCVVVSEFLWLVFIVWSMFSVLLLWYLFIMMWFGCMCSVLCIRLWMVIRFLFFRLVGCDFIDIRFGWLSLSLVVFLMVMMCFLLGMKLERMFSSVVLFELVLLVIMMLCCLCMVIWMNFSMFLLIEL